MKRCPTCKNLFTPRKPRRNRKPQRYCSRPCWLKVHNSLQRNTAVSQSSALKRRSTWVQKAKPNTRRKVNRSGKRGLEYRHIAESALGRELEPEEIIHHINGNVSDNRLENLAVMTQSTHARLHHTKGGDARVRLISLQDEAV